MISQIPNKNVIPVYNNAGFHNGIFRGNFLGDHVTDAQWLAIQNNTFEDLFIGDYWRINSKNWRIAAFNYWLHTGDTECITPHIVIVPDSSLATAKMNNSNTTTGGYLGSDLYTGNNSNTGKSEAIAVINTAFGSAHILSHSELFTTETENSISTTWVDSTVDLMNEAMVYGTVVHSDNGHEVGLDKTQLPLFKFAPSSITKNYQWWLRSITSSESFAYVHNKGVAYFGKASVARDIRPVFAIKA